jgi:hypothetical protein
MAPTETLQVDVSQQAAAIARWDDEGGASRSSQTMRVTEYQRNIPRQGGDQRRKPHMPLTQLTVDEGPHNNDGLLLHAWDGTEKVTAFIGRRVMEGWVDPKQPDGKRQSLFSDQYNALGKRNLSVIQRIVASKYRRGAAFNRRHPFVDVLPSDITESGEVLDVSELLRARAAKMPW